MVSITGVNNLASSLSHWNCADNSLISGCREFLLQVQQKCYQNEFSRYTLSTVSFHLKNRFEASFQYTSIKLYKNTLKLLYIIVCSSVGVI